MAKKPRPKAIPVTDDVIEKTSETNAVKALVALADAYNRVALKGPFEISLPAFVSAWVGGNKNAYRRFHLELGVTLNPGVISLGKKSGLIFTLTPHSPLKREGNPVERVEMSWDDIINHLDPLDTLIEDRLNQGRSEKISVDQLNFQIKEAIAKNPSMHKILTEGFVAAQVKSKETVSQEGLEEIPGFGTF